jgi:nucleotide-binding universal stress UspA family protein
MAVREARRDHREAVWTNAGQLAVGAGAGPALRRSAAPIVCAVDGSPASVRAARVAGDLCERLGAPLIAVHVTQPIVAAGAAAIPGAREDLRVLAVDGGREVLRATLEEAGVEDAAEIRVALGGVVDAICTVADDEEAELIVAGSRSHGAIARMLLGSVAAGLCRTARCPVLVVPLHAR